MRFEYQSFLHGSESCDSAIIDMIRVGRANVLIVQQETNIDMQFQGDQAKSVHHELGSFPAFSVGGERYSANYYRTSSSVATHACHIGRPTCSRIGHWYISCRLISRLF